MSSPPRLTDRTALSRFRRRARESTTPALFLHRSARIEIEERLAAVNRHFTAPAVITGFPEIWQGWHKAAHFIDDSPTLELHEGGHDLILHVLCLHWADDPVGQLVQSRRALKPDGLFLAVTFGGRTLAELRSCLAEAEAAITGGLSPRVVPMAEIRDLGGLLQRAGFALPVADASLRTIRYQNAFHLMRDLRAMGETNAQDARLRRPTRRLVFAEAARLYADRFGDGTGGICATVETIALTGWAPAPDQPKPLRPGSAASRLADALGTAEQTLPERAGD